VEVACYCTGTEAGATGDIARPLRGL